MKIQSIWIEIFPQKSESSLVCTIYRPPENSKHLHENFSKLFDDMLSLAMRNFRRINPTGTYERQLFGKRQSK